jgi:hypothetical protein
MNAAQYDSWYDTPLGAACLEKARSSASVVIPPLSSTKWSAFAEQAAKSCWVS